MTTHKQLVEAEEATGIPKGTLEYRVRVVGMTLEEAIAYKRPLSLIQMCEIAGVNSNTVRNRINNCGWSLERSLTTPSMTAQQAARMNRGPWRKSKACIGKRKNG